MLPQIVDLKRLESFGGIDIPGLMRNIVVLLFTIVSAANSAWAALQTYGIIGDAGLWNSGTEVVRKSMMLSRVQQLILPGDNLYDPRQTYAQVWSPWIQKGFIPSYVAIGNHNQSYAEEIRFFRMPGAFYTKVDNGVRWIILNSDDESTAELQTKWFDRTLSAATEKIIFLVFHHPSYTVSHFHPWTEKFQFQSRLRPLIWKHRNKITAILNGHDHIAALISLNEIPLVVSGASQEQRADVPMNYTDENVNVRTLWYYRGLPHWVRLDINTDTQEVWLNFVEAPRNFVDCSVRILPRPFLMRNNCGQTTLRRRSL